MTLLFYVGCAVGLFATVGSLLPLLPYDDYWIRGFDFPRVQLLIMLCFSLIVIALTRGVVKRPTKVYVLLGSVLVAAIFQSFQIVPYLSIAPVQVIDVAKADLDTTNQFDLIICNVLQDNKDHATLLDYVTQHDPHVLLTLETNKEWENALTNGLSDAYKYTIKIPLENRYGMHLYSRLPIRNQKVMHLITDSIPSIYTQVQLASGSWINLYGVHPTPPSPTEETASTGRDAELAKVGEIVTERGNENTIVAGDLNDVAWSSSTRLFQRLSGLLDPRRGRGLYNSFNAKHWYARWPLDHVFHSKEFQLVDMGLGPDVGSDHFPIEVRLQFLPSQKGQLEEVKKQKGDNEEANETINDAKNGESDGLIVE